MASEHNVDSKKRKCEDKCNIFKQFGNSHCKQCEKDKRIVYIFLEAIVLSIILIAGQIYCIIGKHPTPLFYDILSVIGALFLLSVIPFVIKVLYQTSRGYIT